MEKTTKKKKSKKGLRKRIGIIAVGGLSLVLTVCLSVGATLAWFAGSTWSSKSLYMGGPVYVEMQGRGDTDHSWKGGDGNLDIRATATNRTGTVENTTTGSGTNSTGAVPTYSDVLLPGQKVEIYSNARVYSTAETNTIADAATPNISSGASTGNTSNGTTTYRDESGRVTTTTTSVLRARFSIDIEFDPGNGFNNFTDALYMYGYPKQSTNYTSGYYEDNQPEYNSTSPVYQVAFLRSSTPESESTTPSVSEKLNWSDALGNPWTLATSNQSNNNNLGSGRRDGVATGTWTSNMNSQTDLEDIKAGTKKSIYQWKFVSKSEYEAATATTSTKAAEGSSYTINTGAATAGKNVQMGYPFNGEHIVNGNGYYGVWIVEDNAFAESDAFYKARCNAYLNTYVEYYKNEYGNIVTRTVAQSVQALEDKLNEYFVKLVNDSSNKIHAGDDTNNVAKANASWLYIDPSIGNDTNTDEISTQTGGWWYLVEDNGSPITNGNKVTAVFDNVIANVNYPIESPSGGGISRSNTNKTLKESSGISKPGSKGDKYVVDETSPSYSRLDAKLYEISPENIENTIVSYNGTSPVKKVVSDAFPFVNGTFALPADALTNIFANAKLTFKISFQALQAFFPYTEAIDSMDYKNPLLGTAKALSIRNAIPIYNEAFDYQETNGSTIEGL